MRSTALLAGTAAFALALIAPVAARADRPEHQDHHTGNAKLLARAVLPATTFAPGPPSGTLLGSKPINGVPVPFDGQPVQGFSATLPAGHYRYWVMTDNGYGAIENSADFNLRVYLTKPALETAAGGPGTIAVESFFELRDPDHEIPFAIVNEFSHDRVLTGADFDIESMQRDPTGPCGSATSSARSSSTPRPTGACSTRRSRRPTPTTPVRRSARRRTRSATSRARCAS